jgi:hypothetical protein
MHRLNIFQSCFATAVAITLGALIGFALRDSD